MTDKTNKGKKRTLRRILYLTVLVLCIIVLIHSIYTVITVVDEYSRGEKLYLDLSEYFHGEDNSLQASLPSSQSSAVKETEFYQKKLAELKEINPDIYGFIEFENTGIGYPIVHGDDNVYYLNHDYTGAYLAVGSIFADYRTGDNISENYNTVLYGHNIVNGSMFHIVERAYRDNSLFEDLQITVYTAEGIFTYKPVSVYETSAYDNYYKTDFEDENEFSDFVSTITEKSVHLYSGSVTEKDRLLTLSTCTNRDDSERFAMHSVLVDTKGLE